jgi:probable rRNA maturation factor
MFELPDVYCEVSVLITDDNGIKELNGKYRGIEMSTDVLSFPMQEFSPGEYSIKTCMADPATGLLPLGDIIISAQRLKAQAREYGHSIERETAYLTVHSTLHLFGYDHLNSADKKKMRGREKEIMQILQQEDL